MWILFWCMGVPSLLLVFGIYFAVDQTFYQEPHYSVLIGSVSGLDDPVLSGRHALDDLQFNLIFRVSSHGFWARECAEPGILVDVSYRGVSLASGETPAEEICAAPRDVADRAVTASGAGVVAPGSVLDGLMADMRSGVQFFDVELRGHGWGKNSTWTCGPRLVGDDYDVTMDCAKSSGGSGHA
jgi:hypothetical protein